MPDHNSSNKGLIATFFISSFILAAFSGYQTFKGYESTVTTFWAILIGLIAGFFIFYLTIEFILRRVYGNKPVYPIIIALSLIIMISFPANFNSLYSYFTQKNGNLSELSINNAWSVFDSNMKKAKEALGKIEAARLVQEKFNQLQNERNNLIKQITDPNNPGMGKKAQDHLRKIESLLGGSGVVSRLASPRTGASSEEYANYANELDTLIGKIAETNFREEDDKYGKIIADINTNYKNFEKSVQEKDADSSIILGMNRVSTEIQNSLKAVGVPLDFEKIHTETASSGEIPSTFVTAFVEMPQPMTTGIIMLLSFAIDLLLPALGFFIFSPGDGFGESKDSNAPIILNP